MMKSKKINSIMTLVFLLAVVLFWGINALLDFIYLNPEKISLWDILFFHRPHYDLVVRMIVFLCFLTLGLLIMSVYLRSKKLENRFQGKEEWFRYIIKHNPNAIAVYDKDLRFIMVSDRYLADYNLVGQDVIGKHHYEVFSKIPDKWRGVYERCLAGSIESSEEDSYVKLDGNREYNRWEVRPWYLPNGKIGGIIAYIEVITDRKKTEDMVKQQYRQIQRHYEELEAINQELARTYDELASAKEIIDKAFLVNPLAMTLSRASDGTFIDVNNTFLDMVGLSREEVIGKTAIDLNIWPSPEERRSMLKKMRTHGYVRGIDLHIYLERRGYRWIRYFGEQVDTGQSKQKVILSVFQDITEQKIAQEALVQSETKFRALFENSADATLIINDGVFVDCNRAALDMLNYSYKGQLLDKRPEDISPELQADGTSSRERISDILDRVSRGETIRYEWLHSKAGGEIFPVEVMLTPIPLKDKRIIHTVWRDLTERKRLELQFLQSQKMEAVGRLAGGVAHDFNNMLTTIIGYSELVQLRLKKNNPIYTEVNEIREAAERAASLTQQLLVFSRKQMLQPEIFDLNRVIMEMEKMLRRMIGEDVDFNTSLEPRLYQIRADKGQIGQVIMNLVVNARDAMPGGGKLIIRTQNIIVDRRMCMIMPEAKPGASVCISVEDNGYGMDKNVINHLFEPFFTTKPEGEGTGLGLSTVYGIIKQHDGWINVYSEKNKGSVFKIFLPALFVKPGSAGEREEKAGDHRGSGERIILIEDEKGVREYVARVLEENGYNVVQAGSAEEALALFRKDSGFDLVFSDIVLTGKNGIRMVEEMLVIKPDIRVLFSSGYTDERAQLDELEKRGYRFLQKPYVMIKLLKSIREILEKK